jgi:alpha-mannosidase
MSSQHSQTLAALQSALDAGRASIVGGEQHEGLLPLWPLERIQAEFGRGLATYQQHLARRPTVYGRRRYGLSPVLPQLLSKMGFQGALHVTLDDGHFPLDSQAKCRWESDDGSAIDALMKLPRDAAKPESFLDFSRRMGESMDRDHVATLVFAHWPGQSSTWYGDLRRSCSYTSALGKFVTLDEYFAQTNMPGRLSRFQPEDYRAPYLKQAIIRRQADPLSSIRTTHEDAWRMYACSAVSAIGALASGRQASKPSSDGDCTAASAQSLADVLSTEDGNAPAVLVVNPLSFARRIAVDVSQLSGLPDVGGPVAAAAQTDDNQKHAAVDVPAFGFVWLQAGSAKRSRKTPKPIAEGNILRNDLMEVVVSTTTGGIQSVRDFRHRGNRLSQQLALREPSPLPKPGEMWRDPDAEPNYSLAVCESLEVTSASPVIGEITTRGAVMDLEGKRLADFRQTTQLCLGSRLVRVEVELTPHEELRADPWNSYYCARFAWNDAAAELYRGVALGRHETKAKRIEAPEYIDIQSDNQRTSILTGGLPYHRRVGMRMLDSLLLVRSESARTFTLGIAVDSPNPAAAAVELLTPNTTTVTNRRPISSTGWLLHIDARNVLATHLEPIIDDSGACTGFRTRILETQGRAGQVRLTSARPVAAARQLDLLGQPLLPLAVEEDKIVMDVASHEWIYLEATFA